MSCLRVCSSLMSILYMYYVRNLTLWARDENELCKIMTTTANQLEQGSHLKLDQSSSDDFVQIVWLCICSSEKEFV